MNSIFRFLVQNTKQAFNHTSKLSHTVSTACGFFVAIVAYQTYFGYNPPPVKVINGVTVATVDDYNTTLIYTRITDVTTPTRSEFDRSIVCGEDGLAFDAPRYSRQYTSQGRFVTSHKFTLPFRVPPGTKCLMQTTAIYQPKFSLTSHSYPIADMEFTVTAASGWDTASR